MNILFDGRIFKYALDSYKARTGIYWVARNIFLELLQNKQINILLYLSKKEISKKEEVLSSLKITHVTVYTEDDDLSEITSFITAFDRHPVFNKFPNISYFTILYDIIPLLYPDYFDSSTIKGYMLPLIDSLNSCDYYFAISKNTRNDFLNICPQIDPERIKIIPLATNIRYNPNKDRTQLMKVYKKYNIPESKQYLFSLCSLEPRKNLICAVKNFITFIKKNNIDDLVYVLGGSCWQGFVERLEKEIPEYEVYKNKIIKAGYIADDDLEILYSNAKWFVYTSQYEGFGMPPLEAMSCGCPVITSNNSSLPEVVDDAGIMIDYDSDNQHIDAYERYYYNTEFREMMAQKGLERSTFFSWGKTAAVILNEMETVEHRKKQKPLVTIITATYNLIDNGREKWFVQNLESVKSQSYEEIEHIVIDGASTDGTVKLLDKYHNLGWITYYSEPDNGIYDAINKGILKANGKYVVCLNSDDFYCENKAVEWLVKKAEETDADACCASAISVLPGTDQENFWSAHETKMLLFGQMACHQTFLIKTDVMKELGLYDLKYKISADTAFMYKMLYANKKFAMIDPIIITYRMGGASFDVTKVDKDVSKSLYENYGKYYKLTPYMAKYFIHNKFLKIPIAEAIKMGSMLSYFNNPEWTYEYYNRLFLYHLNSSLFKRGIRCLKNIGLKKTVKIFLRKIKNKLFSRG